MIIALRSFVLKAIYHAYLIADFDVSNHTLSINIFDIERSTKQVGSSEHLLRVQAAWPSHTYVVSWLFVIRRSWNLSSSVEQLRLRLKLNNIVGPWDAFAKA